MVQTAVAGCESGGKMRRWMEGAYILLSYRKKRVFLSLLHQDARLNPPYTLARIFKMYAPSSTCASWSALRADHVRLNCSTSFGAHAANAGSGSGFAPWPGSRAGSRQYHPSRALCLMTFSVAAA